MAGFFPNTAWPSLSLLNNHEKRRALAADERLFPWLPPQFLLARTVSFASVVKSRNLSQDDQPRWAPVSPSDRS